MSKIPEEPVDLTEARRKRCEPIVAKIIKDILDKDLLYNDVAYLEQRVLELLEFFYKGLAIEHFNQIFETLHMSLEHSLQEAHQRLWGKDREEITVKDIEAALKKDVIKKGKERLDGQLKEELEELDEIEESYVEDDEEWGAYRERRTRELEEKYSQLKKDLQKDKK
jgi:hypothetical protein|tara:strand:- start:5146 stop:5646 length:501 start_codon:yes stop_codon:yes gene_type:complete